jgi:hypothetical protein
MEHILTTERPAMWQRSAADMVNTCFRHQHPEAYGRKEIPEPPLPAFLRAGRDPIPAPSGEEIPERPMGDPEARVLAV